MTNLTLNNLQDQISGTHTWRRRIAATHAEDRRNVHAAELLEKLATADHATVDPDALATLQTIHRTPGFKDAVNETARHTGFRVQPRTLNDFIEIVFAKLNPTVH
jgi:hypothetical protein